MTIAVKSAAASTSVEGSAAAAATGHLPGPASEEWRDVPNWPGRYRVSNLGNVESFRDGEWYPMRHGRGNTLGHRRIMLGHPGVSYWVHHLVLEAFGHPRPEGGQTRHLNGDPADNRLENLAWGTAQENSDDRAAHGTRARGTKMGTARLTERDVLEIFSLRTGFDSAAEVARWFDVSAPTIRNIWNGKTWGWLTNA